MKNNISINRIVTNIYSDDVQASKPFYIEFLGLELVMDMDWILTFASKDNPQVQISILKFDKKGKLDNTATFLSIEVSDIDKLYNKAKMLGIKIVYPITAEDWGVRRFFVRDPNGATINVLAH